MNIKTIYEIEREIINDLFSDTIFYRGEEYKDEGLVKSIDPINPTTLTGVVLGSYNYMVSITIDEDGDILCDCSCPCDFNCKHAAAVLLKWITIKDNKNTSVHKTKKAPIETLDQLLIKKSKDDLIFLIKIFIERYPELALYVNIDAHKLTVNIQPGLKISRFENFILSSFITSFYTYRKIYSTILEATASFKWLPVPSVK